MRERKDKTPRISHNLRSCDTWMVELVDSKADGQGKSTTYETTTEEQSSMVA